LPEISADPDLLHRALQNLLLNAIDAMPQGGDLTIGTAARNNRVSLSVADTGSGLTLEECERLFTPYYNDQAAWHRTRPRIVQSVVSEPRRQEFPWKARKKKERRFASNFLAVPGALGVSAVDLDLHFS